MFNIIEVLPENLPLRQQLQVAATELAILSDFGDAEGRALISYGAFSCGRALVYGAGLGDAFPH